MEPIPLPQSLRPLFSGAAIGIHTLSFLIVSGLAIKTAIVNPSVVEKSGTSGLELVLWASFCLPAFLTLPLAILSCRRKETPEILPTLAIGISGLAALGLVLSLLLILLIRGATVV